jgi:hypothetical protein
MSDDVLVWLRFEGEKLDLRGVPIGELGDVLIAVQKIVHKTYLFEKYQLTKGLLRSREERSKLALQIGERKRQSDAYALLPFLTDPFVVDYLATLLQLGLKEVLKYSLKAVLEGIGRPQTSGTSSPERADRSVLTGAIYGEVVSITNHINNIGKVERIYILPGSSVTGIEGIVFDESTREYVHSLGTQITTGTEQEISGYVIRLNPSQSTADIETADRRHVRVTMSKELFRELRYRTGEGDVIRFHGRPLCGWGSPKPEQCREFQADRFQVVGDSRH